jgi:hypothetical protein
MLKYYLSSSQSNIILFLKNNLYVKCLNDFHIIYSINIINTTLIYALFRTL